MSKTKNLCIFGLISFFLFSISSVSLLASNSGKGEATIIFDFTNQGEEKGPLAYVIFGIDEQDILKELKIEGKSTIKQLDADDGKEKFLKELKTAEKYKEEVTDNRWISKKGYVLNIYVFYNNGGEKPNINIEEKTRKTRIAEDIAVLKKIMEKITAKGGLAMDALTYKLTKSRAILSISVNFGQDEDEVKRIEIVTGPTEHLFLSADLPISKLSEVKFVGDKGTLEPKETPKVFYIGVNCMIGDIISEKQSLLKNFFIKGMLKLSKKPLDSYGVGIGYRFPKSGFLGIDLSSFSIFASILWTKEDIGEDTTENLKKNQFQFGISYNLDKALDWLK